MKQTLPLAVVADISFQITGDDTSAIQAVLDADVWRKRLLAEQEVGLAL